MAAKVRSTSCPSLEGKNVSEQEKFVRTNSSSILTHGISNNNHNTSPEDVQDMGAKIEKINSLASDKLKVASFEDDEREAFIQNFMKEFHLSRDVAEAQYDAFI